MSSLVVAFDVGGTNTRARVADVSGGSAPRPACDDVTARVSSARELCDFVARVVAGVNGGGGVAAAVVAVAGPVVGEQSSVTAWPADSLVRLGDVERSGLPRGRTRLVNDVVAGAWGALARIEAGPPASRLYPAPVPGQTAQPLGSGNVVFAAPGTGLGAAALVRHGLGPLRASVIGIEVQHTRMPRFAGEIGQVVETLEPVLGHAPSWEDLVSGRGLVRTYDALRSLAGGPSLVLGDDAYRAGGIAQSAVAGADAQAQTAIEVFYRALGHFTQTLVLTFLPCAAVVIGGASTELNLALVRGSGLSAAFVAHDRFGDLLGRIPIFTVGADANLAGGVWLAERM